METNFAPAEKASKETINNQIKSIFNEEYIKSLYSAVSDIVLILNHERQIIYSNHNLLDFLNIHDFDSICGLRFGESMRCAHAFETEGGCGTTEFCRECGSAKAILSSQKGKPDTQECRIIQKDSGDALDLKIRASQLKIGDDDYTIVSVTDISSDKRRRVLERIFFHDIMNTAIGVRGLSELFAIASQENLEEFRDMIHNGASKLVDEIKSQKEISAAESNELTANIVQINSIKFLEEIISLYRMHEVAKDRFVKKDENSDNIVFENDKTLLSRVIGNMTKNALEASNDGDTVTIGCKKENNKIKFWVHNPAFMPRNIQLQVFQRSFSTKGTGRGLGTYSIKLLTERYLKGEVSFTSSEENGTTFFCLLPSQINE
ncbi:MAG: HAMP domain-containing histidine kinase [Desulfobacterales bacterium]|nr:HAMP domain-containing histidine kinase [Desulfobacterales bacterium]